MTLLLICSSRILCVCWADGSNDQARWQAAVDMSKAVCSFLTLQKLPGVATSSSQCRFGSYLFCILCGQCPTCGISEPCLEIGSEVNLCTVDGD